MQKLLERAGIAAILAVSVDAPAQAGMVPPAGVPGPALGLGIPALALLGYGYMRLRDRRKG